MFLSYQQTYEFLIFFRFCIESKKRKTADEDELETQKENDKDSENKPTETENPICATLLDALGADLRESGAAKVKIHTNLIGRLQYYTLNGLSKEENETLSKKYEVPESLDAPLRVRINIDTIFKS